MSNFMEIRSVGAALMYVDTLTDMKVTSDFREYANAPPPQKKYAFCSHSLFMSCI